jgi:hypothetical protein
MVDGLRPSPGGLESPLVSEAGPRGRHARAAPNPATRGHRGYDYAVRGGHTAPHRRVRHADVPVKEGRGRPAHDWRVPRTAGIPTPCQGQAYRAEACTGERAAPASCRGRRQPQSTRRCRAPSGDAHGTVRPAVRRPRGRAENTAPHGMLLVGTPTVAELGDDGSAAAVTGDRSRESALRSAIRPIPASISCCGALDDLRFPCPVHLRLDGLVSFPDEPLAPLASVAARHTADDCGLFMVSPRSFRRLRVVGVPAHLPRPGIVGRESARTPRGRQQRAPRRTRLRPTYQGFGRRVGRLADTDQAAGSAEGHLARPPRGKAGHQLSGRCSQGGGDQMPGSGQCLRRPARPVRRAARPSGRRSVAYGRRRDADNHDLNALFRCGDLRVFGLSHSTTTPCGLTNMSLVGEGGDERGLPRFRHEGGRSGLEHCCFSQRRRAADAAVSVLPVAAQRAAPHGRSGAGSGR